MIENVKEYIEEELPREESEDDKSIGSLSDFSFIGSDPEDDTSEEEKTTGTNSHQAGNPEDTKDRQDTTATV